jgi:hypothetical protein
MRQAIDDRLRHFLHGRPGSQLSDLQRQFAYDRLLTRAFFAEPDRWVLKGATAMLARLGGRARHTLDVDLYSSRGDLDEAEEALNIAAAIDLSDYFRFALSPGRRILQGQNARRIATEAYLGVTAYARFHVDLVTGLELRGAPEEVAPLVPIDVPDLIRTSYSAWPVAAHIADKVCAMIESHPRQGGEAVPSTRYRDLADLVLFAHAVSIDAKELGDVLAAEAARRGLRLPEALPNPEGPGWRSGYARVAREAPDLEEVDLDAALRTTRRFVDPVLSYAAAGAWDPRTLEWRG